MARKGEKTSADTRAKMAAAHKARRANIRNQLAASEVCSVEADKDGQHVIDNCHRRCKTVSLWSRIKELVRGAR
ncbi:hypothetical protein ASF29_23430 [Rhizobium sp. Leaf262]|nr:hypothetical protein ASF29_23430 [Rhizobium sp. Leaf262]